MIDPRTIWSSSSLPSLPTVAIRLLELSRDVDSSIADVVTTVKQDPAISAKILKAANSSLFSFTAPIASIDRAVTLLGTNTVRSLTLSFSLVDESMTVGPIAEHYQAYWIRSVVQASAAEMLAEDLHQASSEFFLAGLLLDVGVLAMLRTIPKEYMDVMNQAQETRQPVVLVEQEVLGINHADIGARLLETWNVPKSLIECVRCHHLPLDEMSESDVGDDVMARSASFVSRIGEGCSNTAPPVASLQPLANAR